MLSVQLYIISILITTLILPIYSLKKTDECETNTCGPNTYCDHLDVNTYECSCNLGWVDTDPTPSAVACTLHTLNDCALNADCQNGASCVDMEEGHACVCPFGYTGDRCDIMEDMCKIDFCKNGATCESG